MKENLSYSNNLPIIEKERQARVEPKPQKTWSKLLVAGLVGGACLGGCMMSKIDNKFSGAIGAAAFALTYFAQD